MRDRLLNGWIIFGVICILESLVASVTSSFNLGVIFPAIFGVMFILYGKYAVQMKQMCKYRWFRYSFRVCIAGMFFFFITLFLLIVAGVMSYFREPAPDADALIVLGAGLRGEKISLTLQSRLDKAIEYLNENEETVVIVSGGQGPNEAISEALAMKRYLVSKEIDENRIIMEDCSTTTKENFSFSKEIIKNYFGKIPDHIVFVSNDFHITRATWIAKKESLDVVGIGSESPPFLLPNFYLREYFAVVWFVAECVFR